MLEEEMQNANFILLFIPFENYVNTFFLVLEAVNNYASTPKYMPYMCGRLSLRMKSPLLCQEKCLK